MKENKKEEEVGKWVGGRKGSKDNNKLLLPLCHKM